jgi:reverse transcriptase-like protein
MQVLKEVIIHSPALMSINYSSDLSVYMGIDASPLGVGWILGQDCPDGKCHPAHFGSISWNEHKAQYSQPKQELYSLFRALYALCVHIIGVHSLVVKMDAQFIRGMI